MTKTLHGMLLSGIAIAGMSLLAFSAAAESPKEMGRGWGGKCAPAGQAACCKTQRNGDTACKNLEREKAGSPAVKNCEEAEKICLAIVEERERQKKRNGKKPKKQKRLMRRKRLRKKRIANRAAGNRSRSQTFGWIQTELLRKLGTPKPTSRRLESNSIYRTPKIQTPNKSSPSCTPELSGTIKPSSTKRPSLARRRA